MVPTQVQDLNNKDTFHVCGGIVSYGVASIKGKIKFDKVIVGGINSELVSSKNLVKVLQEVP